MMKEYLGEYWGEYWGDDFGKSEDEILTHNEIIAHLRGMYEKLIDLWKPVNATGNNANQTAKIVRLV
jgi:hypothetical protein